MAITHTPENFAIESCPDFYLPATDDQFYSLNHFTNGHPLLVMFICNHCPYVKAIEDRLIELGHDLKKENIFVVSISSNDPARYEEDSFPNMKKRAQEKKYSFPYLYDADQAMAKKFGAVCTPDFFLYDKNLQLRYRGRLDDSWKDSTQVSRRELYTAALDLNSNRPISFKQTPSMGCSIKWKT